MKSQNLAFWMEKLNSQFWTLIRNLNNILEKLGDFGWTKNKHFGQDIAQYKIRSLPQYREMLHLFLQTW